MLLFYNVCSSIDVKNLKTIFKHFFRANIYKFFINMMLKFLF